MADEAYQRDGRAAEVAEFAEFARRHQRPLARLIAWRTGRRTDAEDLAQEALLRVWQHWDQFRNDEHRRQWAVKVARNLAVDQTRRRHEQLAATGEWVEDDACGVAPDAADLVVAAEDHRAVRAALAELPYPLRRLVVARAVGEVPYAALAAETGVTEQALRARYHRALRALARSLRARVGGIAGGLAGLRVVRRRTLGLLPAAGLIACAMIHTPGSPAGDPGHIRPERWEHSIDNRGSAVESAGAKTRDNVRTRSRSQDRVVVHGGTVFHDHSIDIATSGSYLNIGTSYDGYDLAICINSVCSHASLPPPRRRARPPLDLMTTVASPNAVATSPPAASR